MSTRPAASMITCAERQTSLGSCAYTAEEAAAMLGVSVATIRRDCRRLGVRRIAGPAVAGFVRWASAGRLPVDLAYYE